MLARLFRNLPGTNNLRLHLDGMELTGVVVIIVTGVFSFAFADPPYAARRWLIVPVIVAFLMVHLTDIEKSRSTRIQHLKIGFMTLLACTLFWATDETFGAYLLFFVLSATVGFVFPTPIAYRWIILFGLISAIAPIFVWSVFWPALLLGASTLGGYIFFCTVANAQRRAEDASAESGRLLAELQNAYRQLEEQARQTEKLAAAQERNRLAREVHDTLGHRLTVVAVQLEGAQRLAHADPGKVVTILSTVREQILQGLGELRSTVAALRAPLEEDLSLYHALTSLIAQFQEATGIDTKLQLQDNVPQLPASKRHAIYRAAQESLTNIQRHASARHAWVQLEQQNGDIVLQVKDDGNGLSTNGTTAGFGLKGLQERAEQVRGKLEIAERPGGGVWISFAVPVDDTGSTMNHK